MTRYAKVLAGAILEYRNDPPLDHDDNPVTSEQLAAGKPRWIPVVVVDPDLDPTTQVKEGPITAVGADAVTEAFTVRGKNADEVAAMIADKDSAYEAEFTRRCDLPIVLPVGGVDHSWHADAEARENLMGVILLIATGVPVPDPRPWTSMDSDVPVSITHAGLVGMGAAIAARKDALFVKKKTMQIALSAMTDPAQIAVVDVTQGWE